MDNFKIDVRHAIMYFNMRITTFAVIVLAILDHRHVAEPSSFGDVRLSDGSSDYEGRVELYVLVTNVDGHQEYQWATVCDDSWDINDANVVCRQLGYGAAISAPGSAHFSQGEGTIYLDEVACAGTETALLDCDTLVDSHDCSHAEDASVICTGGGVSASEATVRLADGNAANQGRLEVYYNDEWGTVCDDYWTKTNADVVCQELGFEESVAFYVNVGDVGVVMGTGQIWLDDVSCTGSEASLSSCTHQGVGVHNCQHSEDVAIVCDTRNGGGSQIRLVGGSNSFSGRVELFNSGDWNTVCGIGWDLDDAEVACKMAGFRYGAEAYSTNAAFGEGAGNILLSHVDCSGTEDNLLDCTHAGLYSHSCFHSNDAGVVCRESDLRLVGGSVATEGRVEVFYNGQWSAVCDDTWSLKDGNVVCRQLGYGNVWSVGGFEQGAEIALLDGVHCTGTESELSECEIDYGRYDCEHAGVTCGDLETGAVRLLDGDSLYEGRVEIYYEGDWGTVCDDDWHRVDGDVVCGQLGYGYAIEVFSNAYFGIGTGSILLDNVGCTGSESKLIDCYHSGLTEHNCVHTEDASVKCSGTELVGGLGMAAICGIIISISVVLSVIWVINKYMTTHNNQNNNCNEKIRNLCGYETSTSTRNIGVSARWQNRGFFNDERTNNATVSFNNQPVDTSGVIEGTPWEASRTRGAMRTPPPAYAFASQVDSIHGFPTATQPPFTEVPSPPYLPNSTATQPPFTEVPSPPYLPNSTATQPPFTEVPSPPYLPNSYSEYPPTGTTTQTVPNEVTVSSPYNPNSFNEYPSSADHDEIPNSPPPSYESVIEGHGINTVDNATAPPLPPYLSSRGGGINRTMTPIGD